MNTKCPQCKSSITDTNVRLVKDHCGHMKCRKCLLEDEFQCPQCIQSHGSSTFISEETVFEQIAAKDNKIEVLYEDNYTLALNEVNPQAPTHFIVAPKKKIFNLNYTEAYDKKILGDLLFTAKNIAQNLLPNGYRIIMNTGKDGGQSVNQLHVHVMGGRQMKWPPG